MLGDTREVDRFIAELEFRVQHDRSIAELEFLMQHDIQWFPGREGTLTRVTMAWRCDVCPRSSLSPTQKKTDKLSKIA